MCSVSVDHIRSLRSRWQAVRGGSGRTPETQRGAWWPHETSEARTYDPRRPKRDGRSRRCKSGQPRGPTLVLVLAVALAGFELGLGCSHDPKPAVVEPAGPPPLPPASGTPIGYLVDDAGELKLSDEQLTKLKAIDDELAGKLATLDAQLHTPSAAAGSGQSRSRRRGGGGGGAG